MPTTSPPPLLPGLNSLGIALVSGVGGGDLGVEAIPAPRGEGTLKVNTITPARRLPAERSPMPESSSIGISD